MNLRADLAATITRAKTAGLTLHLTVEDAERILQAYDEALALLRELNDALVIPGWLQPRVDAVLDRAEQKTGALDTPFLTAGGEPADKTGPQK